jgi:hypothetical protein
MAPSLTRKVPERRGTPGLPKCLKPVAVPKVGGANLGERRGSCRGPKMTIRGYQGLQPEMLPRVSSGACLGCTDGVWTPQPARTMRAPISASVLFPAKDRKIKDSSRLRPGWAALVLTG